MLAALASVLEPEVLEPEASVLQEASSLNVLEEPVV